MPTPRNQSLAIPDRDLSTLKVLAELNEASFNSMVESLRAASPTLTRAKLVAAIGDQVTELETKELSEILRLALYLYRGRPENQSAKDLAARVSESAIHSESQDVQLDEGSEEKLSNRLQKLLELDNSIGVSAKALDVMTEHEHVFCSARVLSDIRPVFAGSASTSSAAVVIHNLQIGYHDQAIGPHRAFYVALDTDDIKELKRAIERAEEKAAALRGILDKSGVYYLEP